MKLIKPQFRIWEQPAGLEGIYKQIERAGRVCYKSEDKITEDSAKPFVDRLINSGHTSVLEQGTVYLKVPNDGLLRNFIDGTPSHFNYGWCRVNPIMDEDNNIYITTNYRHIIEHKLEDYLKYLCEPTEYHAKRVCVHFICDRGILAEFTRHRVFSFSAESTRYCNYSKNKFGNEITCIIPCWMDKVEEGHYDLDYDVVGKDDKPVSRPYPEDARVVSFWYMRLNEDKSTHLTAEEPRDLCLGSLWECEDMYFKLLSSGWKPQQARAVLPNALKTELVMTGFINDWKHFFDLRCATNAHPQAQELAIPLREEFVKKGYITDNK